MRARAEEVQGQPLDARAHAQFTALQRQVAQTLAQGFRTDRGEPAARYAAYGEHLATLQRHPVSAPVSRVILGLVPSSERLPLQRAADEALQRLQVREQAALNAETAHSLQRQLAELDAEATQPVLQRIQARRGGGNPLPEAVKRHLEQGLNHDLSRVRIHDDAEADTLAKGVNAIAFTTGTDIFFQSGQFQPNTQSGLELLAHEVTHTVQQSQGRVGAGIDPDAGLEAEARQMGHRLSRSNGHIQRSAAPWAPLTSGRRSLALQRAATSRSQPLSTTIDTIATPKPGINRVGFVKNTDGANIRTAPAELPGSRSLTTPALPPGTKVFISGTHPQKPEWIYVTATTGGRMVRGYVQALRVTTNLPEPSATLYFVKKDQETLRPLASSIYHQDVQPGRDLRFYEQTVLYLSQKAGLKGAKWGAATVRRTNGSSVAESSVLLVKDQFVWLPSPAFANTLAGKVPSGSITGGAVAQASATSRRLQDVLASISQSPQHLGKIGKEYRDGIVAHLPQIIGITAAFMAAEGLSVLLAATPTGIGQLAAAAIQMGLGAWGAYGAAQAVDAALPHANAWLKTAWNANGNPTLIAQASENFLYMVVQLALAALALLGARGNINKGLKLAENVRVTPPGLEMAVAVSPNGQAIPVPVFRPGSITTVGQATVRPGTGSLTAATGRVRPQESSPSPQNELESALTNKNLTDQQLEELLKKTKNWQEIEEFIGREADTSRKIPGYKWRVQNRGKPNERLELVRDNAQSGNYAPLTVTKDGVVVLKAGGSNRISVYSRYRRNFLDYAAEQAKAQGKDGAATRQAAERLLSKTAADGRPLYQLHHMISDNVAQAHPLVRAALKKVQGYTVDRGPNMYALPRQLRPGEPYIHNGSHPKYDAWVSRELDAAMNDLIRQKKLPLDQIKAADLDAALRKVENRIRQRLDDRALPNDVWEELERGGKKLSQVSPQQEQQTRYA